MLVLTSLIKKKKNITSRLDTMCLVNQHIVPLPDMWGLKEYIVSVLGYVCLPRSIRTTFQVEIIQASP